jgi:hypothetical protein
MHFLYLDETGISDKNKHFILGGAIIGEDDWKRVNDEITDLKKQHLQSVYIDLKGLRRKNKEFISTKTPNPFFHLNPDILEEFSESLFDIIFGSNITYIASIINKDKHNEKYTHPKDPYLLSYEFLIERFDNFLKENNSYGTIYIESSNKSLMSNLNKAHNKYVSNGTSFQKLDKIIESCHFVYGPRNNFAQISDLFINAVFKTVEYRNPIYYEKYKPFIYCNKTGERTGYGIKYFPIEETTVMIK